jgi:two-component system cell cycle sensor histidine kinase/response regulator CckA
LPRIFEPFFTTKSPDKGTGLGLSTVNNIIRHHNGHLQVQSEPGKGTRFRIYLPATAATETHAADADTAILPGGKGELILVVDDEQAVRELTKTTLENYGYRVVTAANGFIGITCFEQYMHEIMVVVSDTDMPFSNGLAAIRSMQQLKPDVHIIIASGGKQETEFFRRVDRAHLTELPKPYTVEQLLNAVAEAIKASGQEAQAA